MMRHFCIIYVTLNQTFTVCIESYVTHRPHTVLTSGLWWLSGPLIVPKPSPQQPPAPRNPALAF